MKELGYVDGKTMRFDFYTAQGRFDQLDEIAVSGPWDFTRRDRRRRGQRQRGCARISSRDAQRAGGHGQQLPILQRKGWSKVSPGQVATSLACQAIRGLTSRPRNFQLLIDVAPNVTRVAYLGLKVDWESPAAIGVRSAAQRLGITCSTPSIRRQATMTPLLCSVREQVQGLFVARNPWNFSNRGAITQFSADRGMPAVSVPRPVSLQTWADCSATGPAFPTSIDAPRAMSTKS